MDRSTTLAFPLEAVFAHLATPSLLGDWLSDVLRVETAPPMLVGIGIAFGLILQLDGHACAAAGEVIAYEPPAMAAYRIVVGPRTHVVRLACAASGLGTWLRIHQASVDPLAVDLGRLERALARRGTTPRTDQVGGLDINRDGGTPGPGLEEVVSTACRTGIKKGQERRL